MSTIQVQRGETKNTVGGELFTRKRRSAKRFIAIARPGGEVHYKPWRNRYGEHHKSNYNSGKGDVREQRRRQLAALHMQDVDDENDDAVRDAEFDRWADEFFNSLAVRIAADIFLPGGLSDLSYGEHHKSDYDSGNGGVREQRRRQFEKSGEWL